uniref:Uncharacterized protein n=1 Tax=Oryza glumipatula TaxID=40148 RepID=A0A0D9YQ52_9ORYZ
MVVSDISLFGRVKQTLRVCKIGLDLLHVEAKLCAGHVRCHHAIGQLCHHLSEEPARRTDGRIHGWISSACRSRKNGASFSLQLGVNFQPIKWVENAAPAFN